MLTVGSERRCTFRTNLRARIFNSRNPVVPNTLQRKILDRSFPIRCLRCSNINRVNSEFGHVGATPTFPCSVSLSLASHPLPTLEGRREKVIVAISKTDFLETANPPPCYWLGPGNLISRGK